jgi:internalin A
LLPDGLIPRFIVRTHILGISEQRWRRGVILNWKGGEKEDAKAAKALVIADIKSKRIEITVQGGSESLRRELIGMVRSHLKNIHSELPKMLDPQEDLELSTNSNSWEGVEMLELAAQQGLHIQVKVDKKIQTETNSKKTIEKELVFISPEPELNKVEPPSAWHKDANNRVLQVFISYSHKDHPYLRTLTSTYLAVLENEKLIQKFTDGCIRAGENWDVRIRDEMKSANIAILLISEHFFASKYIQGVEMKLAKERHASGELEIVGIILSGRTYKNNEWLNGIQLTPKREDNLDLIPLVDFRPRQASGWEVVQEQLRKVIIHKRDILSSGVNPEKKISPYL